MSISKKRLSKNINGIVLVNKSAGETSADTVDRVIHLYQAKKAGHSGTLDPFATGLLPVCLGEGTKTTSWLLAADKTYQATLKLGSSTDTGDLQGEVTQEACVPSFADEALAREKIAEVLAGFCGVTQQIPPMYSSVKHQGRSLHQYARQGIEIAREPRDIEIFRLELIDFSATEIRFEVHCSKGTYIRVLGEDIAKKLGTLGHLTQLHRTQIGVFTSEMMQPLEVIQQNLDEYLLPVDIALTEYEAIYLNEQQYNYMRQGGWLKGKLPQDPDNHCFVRVYSHENKLFAMGDWLADRQRLKIKRGFNL